MGIFHLIWTTFKFKFPYITNINRETLGELLYCSLTSLLEIAFPHWVYFFLENIFWSIWLTNIVWILLSTTSSNVYKWQNQKKAINSKTSLLKEFGAMYLISDIGIWTISVSTCIKWYTHEFYDRRSWNFATLKVYEDF